MKHNRIFLLLFFVFSILFFTSSFSEAAQYQTTRWEIVNNTLFIEHTGSSSPLSFNLTVENNGDKYFLIKGFPAGTQINLQDNWSLDTDGNAVTVEDMSKVTKYDDRNINIKGRNKITVNYEGITFSGRYTIPILAAHYQAWYREPKFSSKDSWLTENYEYNWTWRIHGSEDTVPYFHADKTISGTGQGQIASWQYPMINFYDSRNFELQRYHAAEMKIAGINAVIFDFYGAIDVAGSDYEYPRENSDAFIKNVLDPVGMNYLVFYEEFSALRNTSSTFEAKARIKRSFEWLNSNWFNRKGYVKYNNRPVVMLFVTRGVMNSVEEWNNIASQAGVNPLPLFLVQDAWINGKIEGAFNWMPVNDSANANLPRKIYTGTERVSFINKKFQEFLQKTENHEYLITTAYPGFDGSVFSEIGRTDYDNYDIIKFDNGETFKQTFDLALRANPNIIQLGTWNDYNEDTVIEPTVSSLSHDKGKIETSRNYSSLEYVQARKNQWENSNWSTEDLRAPVELYNLAMSPALTASQKAQIDAAYNAIFSNNVQTFRNIYSSLINNKSSLNPILRAEITTTKLDDGAKKKLYDFTLKTSGTGPFVWEITSGKLPNGLTLDTSTGRISGIPSSTGTSTFTVRVLNSASITDSNTKTFTLTVNDNGGNNYVITTQNLADGKVNLPYSSTLSIQGLSISVKWKISKGSLPNGLKLDENTGTISGTPTKTGTSKFTVSAYLNGTTLAEQKFSVKISKADLGITTSKLKNGTIRKKYKASLKASMSTPLSWTATGLPEGLEISYQASKTTASISGVPIQTGTFNVTVKASNSYGSFTKTFPLIIKNVKPKFITKKLPEAFTGEEYSTSIQASGGETNDPLKLSLSWKGNNIDGLNFENNLIQGIPSTSKKGNYKVKAIVSNSAGSKSKTFTIKLKVDNVRNNYSPSENILTVNDTNNQKTSPAFYLTASELGIISVDESGQYDFDIILSDDIPANSKLIWRANSSSPSSDDEIAEFYDEDGAPINEVPDNKLITVSSWLNKNVIYQPVILVEINSEN